MKNGQDAFGKLFRLLKLQGNPSEPKIKDAGAAAALIADDGVGVGASHGNALGFTLNREGSIGSGRGRLFCQRSCRG
jgi:hypothetical protein